MYEKDVQARLKKIKASIMRSAKIKKEADQQRDHLFSEVLSELDQEYDRLVTLVRTAKYELIFQDVLDNNKNGPSPESSGESYDIQ